MPGAQPRVATPAYPMVAEASRLRLRHLRAPLLVHRSNGRPHSCRSGRSNFAPCGGSHCGPAEQARQASATGNNSAAHVLRLLAALRSKRRPRPGEHRRPRAGRHRRTTSRPALTAKPDGPPWAPGLGAGVLPLVERPKTVLCSLSAGRASNHQAHRQARRAAAGTACGVPAGRLC